MRKALLIFFGLLLSTGVAFAGLQINPVTGKPDVVGSAAGGGSGNVGISTVGRFAVYTGTTTTGGSANFVENGANVGVGTTLPAAKFEVIGTIKATQGQFGNGNAIVSGDANGNIGLGTVTAGNKVAIGSTGQTNFDSNGNLGIGTTNIPSGDKIYTNGQITTNTGVRIIPNAAAGNILVSNSVGLGTWMSASTISASGGGYFVPGNVGINTTGPVGLNTVNPGALLDIQGSMRVTNAGSPFTVTSANVGVGTSSAAYQLTIFGNVGIGTSAAAVTQGVTGSGATSCLCREFRQGICVVLGTCS